MTNTVAGRLMLGFGIATLLLIATAGVGFYATESLTNHMERMVEKDWKKVVLAKDISSAINDLSRTTLSMFVEDGSFAEKKQAIQARRQAVIEIMETLDKVIYHPKGRELFDGIKKTRAAFADTYPKAIDLLEKGQRQEATNLFIKTGMPQLTAYIGAIDAFVKFQGDLFDQSAKQAQEAERQVRMMLIGALLAGIVASVLLTGWIVRSVTGPLGGEPDAAKQTVTEIAGGNLAANIALKPGDDHSLLSALERMRHSLAVMVAETKQGAASVERSSESLAATASQVARSSTQQSDSAGAMAAAVEQLTTSIAHVAASAGDARKISSESGERAESGRGVMENAATQMEQIAAEVGNAASAIDAMGDSSQRISGIVQVIREVADQTNLLALNAAIEAARAGEQGRGFAVVADEVRKLAERTSGATSEIAEMIGTVQNSAQSAVGSMQRIVNQVQDGVTQARQASQVMGEIANGAGTVVAAVNDISYALEEQSVASQQLAQNVERIARMSEENADATRATAGTAEQMKMLAQGLHETVARFRTA